MNQTSSVAWFDMVPLVVVCLAVGGLFLFWSWLVRMFGPGFQTVTIRVTDRHIEDYFRSRLAVSPVLAAIREQVGELCSIGYDDEGRDLVVYRRYRPDQVRLPTVATVIHLAAREELARSRIEPFEFRLYLPSEWIDR